VAAPGEKEIKGSKPFGHKRNFLGKIRNANFCKKKIFFVAFL
jgi:hypothetical protein